MQIGLADGVEGDAFLLRPADEMAVVLGPARGGIEVAEAMAPGPVLHVVARGCQRIGHRRGADARRAIGQPHHAAGPRPLHMQDGRGLVAVAMHTDVAAGTAPIVVGRPGGGGQDHQQPGRLRAGGGPHHEEVVLHKAPTIGPHAGGDDLVEARRRVVGQAPAQALGPAAAVQVGILGRGVEHARQRMLLEHGARLQAIQHHLQRPRVGMAAAVEAHLVARPVAHVVGVGVHLGPGRVFAREVVPAPVRPAIVGMHGADAGRAHIDGLHAARVASGALAEGVLRGAGWAALGCVAHIGSWAMGCKLTGWAVPAMAAQL